MRSTLTALVVAAVAAQSHATLVISGVVDGNESGGIPKGAELVALADIPDLSVYSLVRFTNGGSNSSSKTVLPSISLSFGDFFYLTGTSSSDAFFSNNGFTVGLSNQSVLNINGDDLLAVVSTNDDSLVDVFGLPGQGDTNFYADSIAYRNSDGQTADPVGSVDAAASFTVIPWVSSAQFGTTFGSFVAVPEPTAALFGSLLAVGLGMTVARRRQDQD